MLKGRRAQEWKTADANVGEIMFDADGDEIDDLEQEGVEVDSKSAEWQSRSVAEGVETTGPTKTNEPPQQTIEDEGRETVELRHDVARSDTLLAIARRYAADVSIPRDSRV